MIKQETDKVLMCGHYNRNSAHVKCENKIDTSNKRDNWNHLSIIQTLLEQHTGKARNPVTATACDNFCCSGTSLQSCLFSLTLASYFQVIRTSDK